MHTMTRFTTALFLGCVFVSFSKANSQALDIPQLDRQELAFTYNPSDANEVGGYGFWMQGTSAQFQSRLSVHWGIVADVAGLHASSIHGSSVGLDLITATAGPRFTWSPPRTRLGLFGEALIGTAHGMNSLFPVGNTTESSANSFALQLGGGVDLPISSHFILRPFEADWVRTQLPNSTTNVQNNIRLGVGIVYVLTGANSRGLR
jgi:peptidoglycan-associated lipoprotein